MKKMFLKFSQYSQEYTSLGVSNKVAGPKVNFIKETPVQVFSCEYWEIFKNTFFVEHLWWLLLFRINPCQAMLHSYRNQSIDLHCKSID